MLQCPLFLILKPLCSILFLPMICGHLNDSPNTSLLDSMEISFIHARPMIAITATIPVVNSTAMIMSRRQSATLRVSSQMQK